MNTNDYSNVVAEADRGVLYVCGMFFDAIYTCINSSLSLYRLCDGYRIGRPLPHIVEWCRVSWNGGRYYLTLSYSSSSVEEISSIRDKEIVYRVTDPEGKGVFRCSHDLSSLSSLLGVSKWEASELCSLSGDWFPAPPDAENVVCYFTEKGYREYQKRLEYLHREVCTNGIVTTTYTIYDSDVVYRDPYQVCTISTT